MPVIKIRRGTSTQWAASNRVLQLGELGLDTTLNKLKAGNGTTAWSSLPFLQADADVTELAQDAVATALSNGTHSNITVTYSDSGNSISLATGPDVITQTSLSNTLTNPTTGYVAIGDVGVADGVASLGSNGKIPDSEIPSGITRNTDVQTLTNKTLTTPTINGPEITATGGTPRIHGIYLPEPHFITFEGATTNEFETVLTTIDPTADRTVSLPNASGTIALTSDITTAISNLVDSAPTTLDTLNELAAALGDDANYASTISTALGLKAPLANPTFTGTVTIPSGASISGFATLADPTFTGTVGGITKSMVGLANVDNTTDANKPVSTATQTALDAKSNILITTNAQPSNYTISTTDAGKLIEMSGGGTLTITDSSSFPVGFSVDVLQTTTSQVTIAGTSFTPDATPGLKLRARWSSATIIKRALNSWVVLGDLSA